MSALIAHGLQVGPHEFANAVSDLSKKRFRVGQQSEAVEFLSWLLNALHKCVAARRTLLPACAHAPVTCARPLPPVACTRRDLGGTKKRGSSVIHRVFQGEVAVRTAPLVKVRPGVEGAAAAAAGEEVDAEGMVTREEMGDSDVQRVPFLYVCAQ